MKDFFDHQERFTIEEGDGILSGFDAIMQLAVAKDPPFVTPVLMILSGHKFEVSDGLGIIAARKPLKRGDFIPLLEDHAHELVSAALCVEGEDGVYNRHGSRMFVSSKSDIIWCMVPQKGFMSKAVTQFFYMESKFDQEPGDKI